MAQTLVACQTCSRNCKSDRNNCNDKLAQYAPLTTFIVINVTSGMRTACTGSQLLYTIIGSHK